MDPSTSPTSARDSEPADPWAAVALDRFYRWHAPLYDWTRPFILFGRRPAIRALAPRPGELVLDVGCGTGWSLPRLQASGAHPVGVECSDPMRRQAMRRLARHRLDSVVPIDPLPYGSHDGYAGRADAILFSYSLSMMPRFDAALDRASNDLRDGGRLAVVDFMDARGPFGSALRRSHVHLGPERLDALRRRFTPEAVTVCSVGLWRFYLFAGRRPGGDPREGTRSWSVLPSPLRSPEDAGT